MILDLDDWRIRSQLTWQELLRLNLGRPTFVAAFRCECQAKENP